MKPSHAQDSLPHDRDTTVDADSQNGSASVDQQYTEEALKKQQRIHAPMETIQRPGVPFLQATPSYDAESDVWQRQVELRSLDEALAGDLRQPLPSPAMFHEGHSNFVP